MVMRAILAAASMGLVTAGSSAPSISLRGSPASMVRQHHVAVVRDYTFAQSASDVRRLVTLGKLVPLRGNADYRLSRVTHPFARPQVRTWVERVAPEYHRACGEPMVVTSLTRARAEQPKNAHDLSVHPAGMAVDLRISRSAKCRRWVESHLLALEEKGQVDATREKSPPHYHIAVLTRSVAGAAATPVRRARPSAAPRPEVVTPDPPILTRAPESGPATAPVDGIAVTTLLAALVAGLLLLGLMGWCSIRGLRICPRP
jgi:hypothetical protein